MKVLLIDTAIGGHHLSYLKALIEAIRPENASVILPKVYEEETAFGAKVITLDKRDGRLGDLSWIRKITSISKREKPDIVHFLYSDAFYRSFGLGLTSIKRYARIVVTHHVLNPSRWRDIKLRCIAKNCDALVVHTKNIADALKGIGIKNIHQVEYPYFNLTPEVDKKLAQKKLGIHSSAPVLLALGTIQLYKGLDILIEALNGVKQDFSLLVAGKEAFFNKEDIDSMAQAFRSKVYTKFGFLSDQDFALCLCAADIVVIPYRKGFNGASGPLTEAVRLGKMIVGVNHGSIGQIIEDHHLGYTFESENPQALRETIEKSLDLTWKPDDVYRQYQESLSPEHFQEKYLALYQELVKGIEKTR